MIVIETVNILLLDADETSAELRLMQCKSAGLTIKAKLVKTRLGFSQHRSSQSTIISYTKRSGALLLIRIDEWFLLVKQLGEAFNKGDFELSYQRMSSLHGENKSFYQVQVRMVD